MATSQTLPQQRTVPPGMPKNGAPGVGSAGAGNKAGTAGSGAELSKTGVQALVPVSQPAEQEPDEFGLTGPVARLPVELDVTVPVREFRVRHLLALAPGEVIESQWGQGNDVPLAAGDVQLASCEFEVVETTLAVRITRLA